ncbi:unnamed protein product [Paramecium primaurelia]|uniref:WD40-repeat-containing domain n=1 Tax=Paramecium primaurelia TaxID=5886 RepID=A0A8S1JXZ7_PARPR|nr:unnamed protein product [Paramecium primaurelia]
MTQIQQEKEITQQNSISNIHFKYNLVNSIKQQQKCHSIIFNQISSMLIVTCNENLKIFQFKQGNIKQISFINGNLYNNNCLLFINLQNQFISSNSNGQIRFWSLNLLKNNKSLQCINNDQKINCMLKNREENLLVTGQAYQITFWVRNNQWKFLKSFEVDEEVHGLTLNESSNMILACGRFNYILVIKKIINDWILTKSFHILEGGVRILFYQENKFAFQPWCGNFLQIYTIDAKNEISLIQEVKIKNQQMKTCAFYSPLQFIQNKSIILNKNQNCLILIILKENGELINQQTIQFHFPYVYGQLSNDGNYLVSWERHIKKIQIWQYTQF